MLCNGRSSLSRRSSSLWSIYTQVSVLEASGQASLVLFWGACWLDVSLIPIWMEFLDMLCFRRLIISCNFLMQLCILGSYTLLIVFLLIIPFSLFKTVLGEDVRTFGLGTSRLWPRLGVYVLLIFSTAVFDRSFVDLLVMSIYWARIFWYIGILEQNSLALLPINDIFPSRLGTVTCFLCWHLGKREESPGSRSTFVECCKPVVNWPCYLCIVKEYI